MQDHGSPPTPLRNRVVQALLKLQVFSVSHRVQGMITLLLLMLVDLNSTSCTQGCLMNPPPLPLHNRVVQVLLKMQVIRVRHRV